MNPVRYDVRIGDRSFAIDAEPGKGVRVAGSDATVEIRRVDATTCSVILDGRSYTFQASRVEDGYMIRHGANEIMVAVDSERTRLLRRVNAAAPRTEHGTTVAAPMPALVVRIEVVSGQQVTAGQGLVVLEAMKMENEIRSPRAGVVKMIHALIGKAVEKGEALVTLE
jgi:biotin carboxyl carrier protein